MHCPKKKKKMVNLIEKLEEYFKNTGQDQILKDWQSTDVFIDVKAPTVDEYLSFTISSPPENKITNNFDYFIKNPSFTSDFLINNYYEKSIVWS